MALTDVTTTFDLSDYFGDEFNARRTKAWATNNAPDQTIHDESTGETRVGSGYATVADDGTGSFTHWAPGADANPATWQTYYHFDVPDRGSSRGRRTLTLGPFTVTASGELTALVEEQIATPTASASDYADAAAIDAASALASSESAAASASTAATAADAAVDISGISTSDDVVEALVLNTGGAGPLTSAALSDTYAAKRATLAADQTANATAEIGKIQAFDATAGHLTIGLPTTATAGDSLTIQKADSSAYEVRISGTINGVASSSLALKSRNDSVTFVAESASSWRPAERSRTQTAQPQSINVVGYAGDSITNASGASASNKGYVYQVRWAAGTRLVDQVVKVYATGGYTSAQVLATHIPAACAESNLAVVHLTVGTNDAGTGVTVAQFAANVTAAHAQLMAAGKRMTIALIPPRGSGATATWRKDRAAYNEWISRWAPLNGVPVADTRALADTSTGYLRADCDSGDGTHPNDLGHALIAEAVAAAVIQALPAQPHRQIKSPDVNLLADPAPLTPGAGLPSIWWTEVAGGTGDAPAYSTVADTSDTLSEGTWVEMDWNATTAGGVRTLRSGGLTKDSGWAVADQIEACMTLQIEDVSGFTDALRAGTAKVRFVLLTSAYAVNAVLLPETRATPGVHHAYRAPAPNTTNPSLGIEVTIPTGVHVKVRVGEMAWFNLTGLGVTKSTVGS